MHEESSRRANPEGSENDWQRGGRIGTNPVSTLSLQSLCYHGLVQISILVQENLVALGRRRELCRRELQES